MSEHIRLLIADKHAGLREGIKRVVDEHQAMVIVGEAAEFTQIGGCCRQNQPDVLVLSLNILPNPVIDAAGSVQERYPAAKLLIYADVCDSLCLQSLLDAGVSGCVLKEEPVDEVALAIQVIANGGTYFSRPALAELSQAESITTTSSLTEREREVLQLMAGGMSNRQMAKILPITIRTVKFHVSNIYSKLGGLSRAETIAWAWKNGMANEDTV